jgi:hypothetical protein
VSLAGLYIRSLSCNLSHRGNEFHNQTSPSKDDPMLLVAIAWLYVVLMVAAVEATSANGTLLGAFFTLVLYGLLPLTIVGYLFLSPARRRAHRSAEARRLDPDKGSHTAGDAVAPERKEP